WLGFGRAIWDSKGGSLPKCCYPGLAKQSQLVAKRSLGDSSKMFELSDFEGLNGAAKAPQLTAQPCADSWFALRVKPNHEKPVAAALRGKGLQEFLPLLRSRRQWSDRV